MFSCNLIFYFNEWFKKVCFYLEIFLWFVGGFIKYEGRLEVYYNEIWGRVCDGLLSKELVDVICWFLGFFW